MIRCVGYLWALSLASHWYAPFQDVYILSTTLQVTNLFQFILPFNMCPIFTSQANMILAGVALHRAHSSEVVTEKRRSKIK